ncbi:MAG: PTS sugar transporter subunit IIA [Spirochaetes bacterium]|jgi:mannitol/fructose-specific phosphotransferase system IIA component (Ntr-type)|nr:PTS sugar transporter subunit IIA [Spirochaetota bacterium]
MTLIELIREDVVKVPLKSKTKHDAFRELLEVLKNAGKISNSEVVFHAIIERDDQLSTAIENGIALPHAKTTEVDRLVLAVGISPAGIECSSHDGELSHIFFLLLAPPDQSGPHIEALSEISRATKSSAFRRLLLASQSADEIVELFCDE